MPPRDFALKAKYQRGQLLVNKNITVFFSKYTYQAFYNKNELWKTVRLTRFSKPTISIRFKGLSNNYQEVGAENPDGRGGGALNKNYGKIGGVQIRITLITGSLRTADVFPVVASLP